MSGEGLDESSTCTDHNVASPSADLEFLSQTQSQGKPNEFVMAVRFSNNLESFQEDDVVREEDPEVNQRENLGDRSRQTHPERSQVARSSSGHPALNARDCPEQVQRVQQFPLSKEQGLSWNRPEKPDRANHPHSDELTQRQWRYGGGGVRSQSRSETIHRDSLKSRSLDAKQQTLPQTGPEFHPPEEQRKVESDLYRNYDSTRRVRLWSEFDGSRKVVPQKKQSQETASMTKAYAVKRSATDDKETFREISGFSNDFSSMEDVNRPRDPLLQPERFTTYQAPVPQFSDQRRKPGTQSNASRRLQTEGGTVSSRTPVAPVTPRVRKPLQALVDGTCMTAAKPGQSIVQRMPRPETQQMLTNKYNSKSYF